MAILEKGRFATKRPALGNVPYPPLYPLRDNAHIRRAKRIPSLSKDEVVA
ncbi:MAG: hypothetical protein KIS86_13235 [Devosia sp.]|nr:hypothetical protein [Devosia sp.]